jgi:hypothetical protein
VSNGFLLRPLVPAALFAPATPAAPTALTDMLNDMIGVQYVSGAAGSTDSIDVDFGGAVAIDTVAILSGNGGTTTWTLRGATTQGGLDAAPTLFSGDFAAGSVLPTSVRTHALAVLAAPATFRWWRIGFAGIIAPPEIGRLVMGLRFQPQINFSFGAQLGVTDLAGGDFNRRGLFLPNEGATLRTVGLRWPHATRAESEEQISVLLERIGNRGHVLACIDPDPHPQRQRRLYFGPLRGNLGQTWNVGQRFEWRADLTSVI